MTLHDEWTFTGHCAYTLGCERWRTGCGSCPHLTIYPAIRRDGTHANRRAKAAIYARSRLYVSTPSQWLMDRARVSVLADGMAGSLVIPNGVDRSIFRPGDQAAARGPARPAGRSVHPAVHRQPGAGAARSRTGRPCPPPRRSGGRGVGPPVLCVALGDDGPPQRFDNGELRFMPYRSDMAEVAAFYQAADLYLHAAKAENLATTILEALADRHCRWSRRPSAASPRRSGAWPAAPGAWSGEAPPARHGATGVLVAPGDGAGMGAAAAALLRRRDARGPAAPTPRGTPQSASTSSASSTTTIGWYREIIADWQDRERSSG